jgi:hypothetical protein
MWPTYTNFTVLFVHPVPFKCYNKESLLSYSATTNVELPNFNVCCPHESNSTALKKKKKKAKGKQMCV